MVAGVYFFIFLLFHYLAFYGFDYMKRRLLLFLFLLYTLPGSGQAYFPMPADSATWRYRIYDADFIVQVIDLILYINGTDTVANGQSYFQVFSRQCRQVGVSGFDPPIVAEEATSPDIYFGALRESNKRVYELAGAGEQLIYDFTASVGDSIPAFGGNDRVDGIDSVLLDDGLFHKRYLTSDSSFFVIEGVGSNQGLFPDFNDGAGDVTFICLNHHLLSYLPDTSLPCTPIFSLGYQTAVTNVNNPAGRVSLFPVPATDVLHVSSDMNVPLTAVIFNETGLMVWTGRISDQSEIMIQDWPRGVYFLRFTGEAGNKKIIKIALD
jgi:hypothetical protein